ncbi:hypothetical protein GFL86_36040 [Rhizobium laguerreae]|nr:hypothetical protein [Rhizobium laguerreae]
MKRLSHDFFDVHRSKLGASIHPIFHTIEATDQDAERVRAKFEDDARTKVKAEIDEQVEKPEHGTA